MEWDTQHRQTQTDAERKRRGRCAGSGSTDEKMEVAMRLLPSYASALW